MVTATEAVLAALSVCGAKRVALMTPYPAELVEMERAFLARAGIDIVSEISDPRSTPVEQGMLPPERWTALANRVDLAGADAFLIRCAGIQIAPLIDAIEARGKPVVTSNQALLWHCLRTLGFAERPRGYGALLAGAFNGTRPQPPLIKTVTAGPSRDKRISCLAACLSDCKTYRRGQGISHQTGKAMTPSQQGACSPEDWFRPDVRPARAARPGAGAKLRYALRRSLGGSRLRQQRGRPWQPEARIRHPPEQPIGAARRGRPGRRRQGDFYT
jgi:hypothetical protein